MSGIPPDIQTCTPKMLPADRAIEAARLAVNENPANGVNLAALHMIALVGGPDAAPPEPAQLAVLVQKFWRSNEPGTNKPRRLTVAFLDNPNAATRRLILQYANLWGNNPRGGPSANVDFVETTTDPIIRITRTPGSGYWSYLGTDCLAISPGEPTMNLAEFTDRTPESEYHRVVCHEFAHALGSPHEHARREVIARLIPDAVIAWSRAVYGWPEWMTRQQILTPIEDAQVWGSAARQDSIACYEFPGTWDGRKLTVDGKPIVGGDRITDDDYEFMARVLPGRSVLPPPDDPAALPALTLGGSPIAGRVEGPGKPARFRLTLPKRTKVLFDASATPAVGPKPPVFVLVGPDGKRVEVTRGVPTGRLGPGEFTVEGRYANPSRIGELRVAVKAVP